MVLHRPSHIFRNNRGVALIEFVLVFPILFVLILFIVEYSRYFLIQIKVQKTAYTIANIITQYQPASATPANAGQLSQDEIFNTIGLNQLVKMVGTDQFANANDVNMSMVISSVRNEVTTYSQKGLVVKWQACISGGVCWIPSVVTQALATVPAAFVPDTPANFAEPYRDMLTTMRDGENMIVVEVSYSYAPSYRNLFLAIGKVFPAFSFPGLNAQTITHIAFFSPRNQGSGNGGLDCLPPSATGSANTYFSYQDCPCTNANYASGCSNLPQ